MQTIQDALAHVSSPREKMRIMLENKLHKETTTLLMQLVRTHVPVFFEASHHCPAVAVGPVAEGRHLSRLLIGFYAPDTDMRSSIYRQEDLVFEADFELLSVALGWDKNSIKLFVRKCLVRIVEYPMNARAFRAVQGSESVSRTWMKDRGDQALARRVELWNLRFRVQEGRIFELRQRALPVPRPQGHGLHGPKNPFLIRSELNPIICRFRELGETEKGVREVLMTLLESYASEGKGTWQDVLAVGYALITDLDVSWDRVESVVRQWFAYRQNKNPVAWSVAGTYLALNDIIVFKKEDEELLVAMLTRELAKGHAGHVKQWFVTFGESLGMGVPSLYVEKRLFEGAYREALENERFGIAAALALSCNNWRLGSREEVLKLVERALLLKQQVSLAWESSITKVEDHLPPN